jgi:hypothetical protein
MPSLQLLGWSLKLLPIKQTALKQPINPINKSNTLDATHELVTTVVQFPTMHDAFQTSHKLPLNS